MQLAGSERFLPDSPDRYTAAFLDNGRIGVVADCNQCGGTYSVGDGTLTVSPLACTLILCPTPHGSQFASLIDGRSALGTDVPGLLEIRSPEGQLVLER